MKNSSYMTIFIMIGIVMSFVMSLFNGYRFTRAKAETYEELHLLTECRALIREMDALRDQPELLPHTEIGHTELAQRIEWAATSAGINTGEQLIRIDPRRARRLDDLPYLEKSTDIVLDRVTLRQFVDFVYALYADSSALQLSHLRIQAPHDDPQGEHWLVEATLSYIHYAAPPSEEDTEMIRRERMTL